MNNAFEKNVFINCPFDGEYNENFLKPLLFTIMRCHFNPCIASEGFDSSQNRLQKIKGLIESSQYSIHDLSRIKSSKKNEYYRLNMPFEIGLDFGCKYYKSEQKRVLILETEKYGSHKALSDIAGGDMEHYGKPIELVRVIRKWLSDFCEQKPPGGSGIWDDYNEFHPKLKDKLKGDSYSDDDIASISIAEFKRHAQEYIDSLK